MSYIGRNLYSCEEWRYRTHPTLCRCRYKSFMRRLVLELPEAEVLVLNTAFKFKRFQYILELLVLASIRLVSIVLK
ncbi:hypothetical protein MHBO_004896 [Bonamia ostreae]|uniref:Uncharacterized protein n=1 Tax=Bonamia ostreae TaxID=126728 RepID=A0ABV2AUI9_9EUKA